jgi:hypothetical protein
MYVCVGLVEVIKAACYEGEEEGGGWLAAANSNHLSGERYSDGEILCLVVQGIDAKT